MTAVAVPPPAVPDVPPLAMDVPAEPARRVIAVVAQLLPDEIVAGRRLTMLKKKIGYGLVLLTAVLALVYVLSWVQTGTAHDDLASVQAQSLDSQRKLQTFTPLLHMQQEVADANSTLSTLLANDVSWPGLLKAVRAAAPKGITITAMAATVTDPTTAAAASASAPTGLAVLNQSGQIDIGTLGITGTATDKDTVAAYVDALTKVKGLAAPFPANVSASSATITFDLDTLITKAAYSGRYAPDSGSGTGN